jgi:hypothetical protein
MSMPFHRQFKKGGPIMTICPSFENLPHSKVPWCAYLKRWCPFMKRRMMDQTRAAAFWQPQA